MTLLPKLNSLIASVFSRLCEKPEPLSTRIKAPPAAVSIFYGADISNLYY
ncbi:hypothetical protein AC062_1936 [Pasteurellaceae bacterium NI1060]|nr:hypothetical protein AC062_1936 [Pasteurellaceae bacterium NI1060]